MADKSYLDWPFLAAHHRVLESALDVWAAQHLADGAHARADVDDACRRLVRQLGDGGWLRHAVAGTAHGGAADAIDTRAICLIRETLARHDGLADFAFAMQGLGAGAISLHGSEAQRARYLPRVARGEAIAAFALSEPQAGSDVAAMQCAAVADGDEYVLDGEKTWISNGGIADFYLVFARTGEQPGARGISAFIVDADTPGFEIAERIEVIAPHPLARLRFTACRIPASQRVGTAGQGFKVAMATLDVFRTSVAAAALGFARRALDEALARATQRQMFGQVLADFQLTQARLAQMASGIDAAALLTYRAAWQRDGGRKVTKEAAMAKLAATETAQQVIDAALQMFGGLGVVSEQPVERLYREIRALRIYEGASEVQQLIIARELLRETADAAAAAGTAAENAAEAGAGGALMEILQPPGWPRPRGYANGVAASGRMVFVSGMIGWDAHGVFHTDDFAGQARQALENSVAVLAEAGARPEHIVRMTWYVVDKREYLAAGAALGAAYRAVIGAHYPAMSAVQVAALVEDRARVEIEVTAVVPEQA